MAQSETWEAIPVDSCMEKEFFTEAEYFEYEENAFRRFEFVPVAASLAGREGLGVIKAMSGGTAPHAEIAGNTIASLREALRASGNRICHVYTSDLKIHCVDGLNTYPDLSVVCGKPVYHNGRLGIVTNPLVLGEVLSPSTEAKDRGAKWASYRTIPTLQHYLLISAAEPRVEIYTRISDTDWEVQFVDGLEATLALPALGVTLTIFDVYDLVELGEDD